MHSFYKGVLLGAVVSVVVMMAGTALAGSGIGAVFNLGKVNAVNRTSTLSGAAKGKLLQVTNKGSGAALALKVRSGKAPLTVNSTKRVKRLNADLLDGLHASELRKVLTARRDLAPSGSWTSVLTLAGLGRISCLAEYAPAALPMVGLRFQSTSQEVVHFQGDLWPDMSLPVTGTVSSTFYLESLRFDEVHEVLWSSKRAAVLDVHIVRFPGSDVFTILVEATVQ
jgi:hypothetical protein